MFAIIETGGKQYKVQENDLIYVEKLEVEAGQTITFENVLMLDEKVGTPYVKGATVTGVVQKHGKGPKIIVYKYKSKKNYHKKKGHRQPYTKIEITAIKG